MHQVHLWSTGLGSYPFQPNARLLSGCRESARQLCRSDADQILALTRQVCALKLVESQMLADVSASKTLADSRGLRIHHLEHDVKRLKDSAGGTRGVVLCNCKAARGGWNDASALAELQSKLTEKEQEMYAVRCELVESQQQAARQQLMLEGMEQKQEVQRLEAEAEISKAKHAAEECDEAWKAEAQQQQNSVVQHLSAADSRNRELSDILGRQVCH